VLIYDQTCAAEKRRRSATFPSDSASSSMNWSAGSRYGVRSNCVDQPVETEFGRKRKIDCRAATGFLLRQRVLPSFVTVHGARSGSRGIAGRTDPLDGVRRPPIPLGDQGWAAIIDGVGGTGVVTIGAVLGMAAHLEQGLRHDRHGRPCPEGAAQCSPMSASRTRTTSTPFAFLPARPISPLAAPGRVRCQKVRRCRSAGPYDLPG
jgi:hypothetical protein